ncbi:MAG: hypothetical protein AAF492_04755, partial [Verrucomicrobiota bacterium]
LLSHSDLGEDWIELYNPGPQTVQIGGWYLSDAYTNYTRSVIAGGTQILGDDYITFSESQLGFAFSELGDEAALTIFSGSNLISFVDRVDFGAGDREVSFGRYVRSDGRTDFPALCGQTRGALNTYPLVGPIVMSEIMYNPTNGPEFIELVNITEDPVPLYDVLHPTNTWQLTSGIDYVFPTNLTVPPLGVVVLSGLDETSLRAALPISPDVQVFGPWSGSLANGGENIRLFRPGDPEPDGFVPQILVERVEYEDDAPWPVSPDGLGPSLERTALYRYGNDPINWSASIPGGTPGVFTGMAQHMAVVPSQIISGAGRILWAAIPGQSYRVEYTDDLISGVWQTLQNISATALVADVIDPDYNLLQRRYYRILWVK